MGGITEYLKANGFIPEANKGGEEGGNPLAGVGRFLGRRVFTPIGHASRWGARQVFPTNDDGTVNTPGALRSVAGAVVPAVGAANMLTRATGQDDRVNGWLSRLLGGGDSAPSAPAGGWQPRIGPRDGPSLDFSGRSLQSRFAPSANLPQVNAIPQGEGTNNARAEIERGQRETVEGGVPQRSARTQRDPRADMEAQFEAARIEQSHNRSRDLARSEMERMFRGQER